MHRFAPVALATILAATAPARAQAQNETQPRAQTPTPFTPPQPTGRFTDPANLAGERPNPRNGRELPIDGGLGPDGQPDNALGLAQILRKLNTRASLMLIVAHPDDEDGGMLAYYSRGLGARVAILTLNRGEGGQNQMTGDFEDALGLLRTQELLSADRYMGVDTQMFGTEVDFGFTKTKAEAFQKWNHERVLYDAVRAVRIFRPLVVASVFEGAVTDGHGQHQVAGQIAQEVFKAAGDPNVFPELTREGILPWQPLKVYARVPFSRVTAQGLYDYATGQTVPAEFTNYVTGQKFTTEPTADITINEGVTDPLLTTCAANPADLPKSLSSHTSSPLSSRISSPLSSRSEAEGSASPTHSASACHPLSYVQFARIGLGLQRSQIGAGMRLPSPGRSDVAYHLYGSRVCAPNLPNPTPNLCTSTSSTTARPGDTPGAPSSASEGRQGGVSRVKTRDRESSPHLEPTSFTTTASENPALANQPTFFDGIDTSVNGLATLVPAKYRGLFTAKGNQWTNFIDAIQRAQQTFDPQNPSRCAPALADSLHALDLFMLDLRDAGEFSKQPAQFAALQHELNVKRTQLEEALALALNVQVNATTQVANVLTRSTPRVQLDVTSKQDSNLSIFPISLTTVPKPGALVGEAYACMAPGEPQPAGSVTPKPFQTPITRSCTLPARMTEAITRPYFYRDNIEQPVYKLERADLRGAPSTPPALTASAIFSYHGAEFTVSSVVSASAQPVQIIPPVSLTLDRNAQVIPRGAHSLNIDVHTETEDHPQGELHLQAPSDWTIRSPQRPLRAGTESFFVSLPAPLQTSTLKAEATISGATYTEGFRPVGYGNLPRTNFYTPATLRIVPVDLKLPPPDKRRIAYLPGTGDDVPAALASIGLTPTILKVSDLTAANLAKFDTVVLGVRTYNAHPDLHGAPTQALLDFARNGGNVVVQYQTPEFTAADAPYPLVDNNERVIDETAPVVLLTTANSKLKTDSQTESAESLLTTPNKITPADFNNWIEERGHGFLDTWDPHYTALTEVHDPGAPAEHIVPQAPQRGGLITVQLGRGRWTYCAFALYRQLPEAVPGAFRLFVNLLNP